MYNYCCCCRCCCWFNCCISLLLINKCYVCLKPSTNLKWSAIELHLLKQMVFSTSANYVRSYFCWPFAQHCRLLIYVPIKYWVEPEKERNIYSNSIPQFTLVALNPCCCYMSTTTTQMKERKNADKCSCFKQLPKVYRSSTSNHRMKRKRTK